MSKELFTVYHCKACNKIEVSQYISKEQMEELGQLTEDELRHFAYSDVEGVKKYLADKKKQIPHL